MGVTFTEEQQAVIDARKSNILVSAAAGSGKTAVLVERIIQMISEIGRGSNGSESERQLISILTNGNT